jgi:ketosteroid isomerase-like protein
MSTSRTVSGESTTPDLEVMVRRGVEAVNRREFDRVMSLYAPDVVWDGPTVGGGVFEGREALRGFFKDWIGAYEDFRQDLEEFRDVGNGVTFGVLFQRGRLPGSSGVVATRFAVVATWSDTVIERLTSYRDIDEARATAERLAEERG